jgi:hypothetical protein
MEHGDSSAGDRGRAGQVIILRDCCI